MWILVLLKCGSLAPITKRLLNKPSVINIGITYEPGKANVSFTCSLLMHTATVLHVNEVSVLLLKITVESVHIVGTDIRSGMWTTYRKADTQGKISLTSCQGSRIQKLPEPKQGDCLPIFIDTKLTLKKTLTFHYALTDNILQECKLTRHY